MSRPAQRFSAHTIFQVIRLQSWVLFITAVCLMVAEYLLGSHDFKWSKNFIGGGLLAWLGHGLFAAIALRTSGAKYKRQVVNNFYLAQALKWLVTMVGFALIFMLLKPLLAIWVFLGYFTLQIAQMILFYYYESYKKN